MANLESILNELDEVLESATTLPLTSESLRKIKGGLLHLLGAEVGLGQHLGGLLAGLAHDLVGSLSTGSHRASGLPFCWELTVTR